MLFSEPLFELKFLNLDYLFYQVFRLFDLVRELSGANFFTDLYLWIKILASILAIIFIIVSIYAYIRIKELKDREKNKLELSLSTVPVNTEKNEKWKTVQVHIKSNNPADWRLAIIEADTILDEMVARMQYSGENLGERLKKIEPSDFLTLNEAWEAHKVRNRIAHEGSAFQLDHKEAKRVIDLYEKVFHEFKYI